jgi:hypothetical protein
MRARLLPLGTLMVTALNTGLTFAHLLEMPAKRRFDAPGYLRTQQIYRTFGPLGGLMEPGAVAAAAMLTYAERKRASSFSTALVGTGLLASALAAWLGLVAPMNTRFGRWTEEGIPSDWQRSRDQWEFAHAARAILQVAGLGALTYAALSDTGSPSLRDRVTGRLGGRR